MLFFKFPAFVLFHEVEQRHRYFYCNLDENNLNIQKFSEYHKILNNFCKVKNNWEKCPCYHII